MSRNLITYPTNYPSDCTNDQWEFCAPYLCLMTEDAPQRRHCLRGVFNALRYLVKTGCPWRYLPSDFPPFTIVYQQAERWVQSGAFEAMAEDLRKLIRALNQRSLNPSAMIMDGRTIQSMPESGTRAGYDGYKRKKGSKVHVAVDTLGNLLAVVVTPANEQERHQVGELCDQVQEACGQSVQISYADQGYTGDEAREQCQRRGIELVVVKLPKMEGEKKFVLLPRRWVVERSFAWLNRFRRLARDYERMADHLAGYHWVAAIMLALNTLLP
jgi:transposase